MVAFRFLLLVLLELVVQTRSQPHLMPLDVTALFDVNLDDDTHGGCRWVGQAMLNRLLQDALLLAIAGENLAWSHHAPFDLREPAQRLFDNFFRPSLVDRDRDVVTVKLNYMSVGAWLRKGGPINDGYSWSKPKLFCNDNWLVKKQLTDPYLGDNGVPSLKQDGTFLNFVDLLKMNSNLMANLHSVAASKRLPPEALYPYYSPKYRFYPAWDKSYGNEPDARQCAPGGLLGATILHTFFSSITLCPKSFTILRNGQLYWEYAGLRPLPMRPIHQKHAVSGHTGDAQMLQEQMPTANIFFHELLHLVLGAAKTVPPGGELETTENILRAPQGLSIMNPTTYAQAAVAWDLTSSSLPNQQGVRPEWFLGYCTI